MLEVPGSISAAQATISSMSEHAYFRVICRAERSASFLGSGFPARHSILFCCVLFGNLIITGGLTIAMYTTSKIEFFI